MLIGVISDTHIPSRATKIPEQVIEGFSGVDLILHAGDLTSLTVVEELERIAPVKAVCGNMDSADVARHYPREMELVLEGVKIALWHGSGGFSRHNTTYRALERFPGADCIIFGHTHQPVKKCSGNTLLLNPGSPTDKRWEQYYSYALLEVKSGQIINAELHYF